MTLITGLILAMTVITGLFLGLPLLILNLHKLQLAKEQKTESPPKTSDNSI